MWWQSEVTEWHSNSLIIWFISFYQWLNRKSEWKWRISFLNVTLIMQSLILIRVLEQTRYYIATSVICQFCRSFGFFLEMISVYFHGNYATPLETLDQTVIILWYSLLLVYCATRSKDFSRKKKREKRYKCKNRYITFQWISKSL